MALLLLVVAATACSSDDKESLEPSLDVTPANIAGTWMLDSWNGSPLANGTYCYITFNRKERTYRMYQKFDSMYARCITGSFSIDEDRECGYIITGTYDYGMGEWNNSYIVTELYASGSMVWTVKGNEHDVCRYIRCEEIPQAVLDEADYKIN